LRLIWLLFGLLTLALGVVGAFLPLLPTVPFLLLSAFCFSRSSDRLHGWLINHNLFGPPILTWRESGAIRRKGKIWATVSLFSTLMISFALGFSAFVVGIQILALMGVALFIWSRPEH